MDLKKPFLSLIVTVYNLEKYLSACLESILVQDETDYEILLVDSNSTDKSGVICRDYAAQYSQIQYFVLEGKPVMWDGHRYGLEQACGDYIWFVDGDDLLAKDALQIVVKALRKTDTDVLFGGFTTFMEGSVSNFSDSPYEAEHISKCSKDEALEYLIETQQPVLATWRLVFSRAVYSEMLREERFLHLIRDAHQDTGFNVFILTVAKSLQYVDNALYCYRVRETSISRTDIYKKIPAYSKALLVLSYIATIVAKTKSERKFAHAYYRQFVFLLSTIVGGSDACWNQEICKDIDDFAEAIDLKKGKPIEKEHFYVNKLFEEGSAAALDALKEHCRDKLSQIAALLKNKGGDMYLAPTGNVGIFLKTALEQQGVKVSGFFDNDKAKDGMFVADVVVRPPAIAAEISKNQSITILIAASYASVPRQLKRQFLSLGISASDLITIEF